MTVAEIDEVPNDPRCDNTRGHGLLAAGEPQNGSSCTTEPLVYTIKIEHWTARIAASWQHGVEAIIETGRLLAGAKAALPHGAFGRMIATELPFDARTAQMLMAIAADPRLRNPNHGSLLPPSWRSLYELTRLDDVTFEARIADGTIRADMERRDIATVAKQKRREARERELGAQQRALPVQKFGVIAADPEWEFEPWSHETGMDRAAANHYPTSCLDFIKLRDVPSIAAEDCVLFLCATPPMLPHALLVMAAWGFDYKTNYVFEKDRMITGYWARFRHEHLLIGTRGHVPCPAPGTQWDSLVRAPTGKHSAKGDAWLEMIEQYFPSLPKIELNRRGPPRVGWSAWGNETEPATAFHQKPWLSVAPVPGPPPSAIQSGRDWPRSQDHDALDIPNFLRIGHPDCWRNCESRSPAARDG